jgi:hypothetical protein
MLKKDDKSQQVVYLQVFSSGFFFILVRRFKRSIFTLGGHRDVHDFRDRDTVVLVKRA